MRFLLDTDVCVDVLRGREEVVERLRKVSRDDCFLSAVTSYELQVGALKCADPERELGKLASLSAVLGVLGWDEGAAVAAAKVRATLESEGTGIGPYDTLIAGQALQLGVTLVTNNLGEFSRVPDLEVVTWRK